jgi:hypothetical protein
MSYGGVIALWLSWLFYSGAKMHAIQQAVVVTLGYAAKLSDLIEKHDVMVTWLHRLDHLL